MKKTTFLTTILILLTGFIYAQQTYVPDDNFENYLETHDANGNTVAVGDTNSMGNGIANDDYVTTSKINTLTTLHIDYQNISDLTGIEDFTALQELYCHGNQLTSLDITNNTVLQKIDCYNNQLTSLDITQNTALQILWCNGNQLTSLDITQNSDLISLLCYNNQLTDLNMQNGNNTNLIQFGATSNTELTCVLVDDAGYMNSRWSNAIDATATYSEHCPLGETYVPDDNFENYLETHDAYGHTVAVGDANSMGNGIANDDYVTTSKINTITSLNIDYQNITDLTGIADFTALQALHCQGNQLTDLGISQNINLTYLYCDTNQLSNLDVTHNIALQELNCSDNQLTNMDISQNVNLQLFNCNHNQITELDASQNTALQIFNCSNNHLSGLNLHNGNNINLTDFDATINPDLICVEVDDPVYMNTNWANAIDATAGYNTHCTIGETYIPDNNFETYLETHDTNGYHVPVGDANSLGNGIANDNYVTTSKINVVTKLNVNSQSIADLTGIADFTALQELYCQNNLLTSIDITHNTALQKLDCSNNQLTNLNVTQNTNLQLIDCNHNQLSGLDITQNSSLTSLICFSNQLTGLNINQNTALLTLSCYNNQITGLDASLNPALTTLLCNNNQLTDLNIQNGNNINLSSFDATNNPDLTCIFVDDTNYMNTNWANAIDPNVNYVTTQAECNAATQTTYVPDDSFENYLETHDANGNYVPDGNPNSMGNGIANDNYVLTSRISNVTHLNVNMLNIADLTGIEDFQNLQMLLCNNNHLTSLDVTQNLALQELNCNKNQLTSLDVTHNLALQKLDCWSNQLTNLNVAHNVDLQTLNCYSNQITQLDVTHNLALQNLVCYNNQITSLDITQNTDLQELDCSFNPFTQLDVTQNTNLQYLDCVANGLTNLDVTHNANLILLVCSQNQLASLDVTHNVDLQNLYCDSNQLTSLDVTQNTALQELYCGYNQLINLDVTQNINLYEFDCGFNMLTTLDLTQSTNINKIICLHNQLTSLDIRNGNNRNLRYFRTNHNPNLTCLFVDDAGFMNTYWDRAIDPQTTYVETQAQCDALNIDEDFKQTINIYPNPFSEYIEIEIPDKTYINNICVQNIQGQTIYNNTFTPQINLSGLPSGIYFVNIENKQGNITVFKLIKH